jgi:hypothetical protein
MRWLLIVLLLASAAQADVTRKHKISSVILGSSEGTTADYYTTDRHAEESSTKYTSGLMKTATGGKEMQSMNITRVDKELVWQLDPKKKTYTEQTFAEFREQMKKGMAQLDSAKKDEPKDTVSEDMYTWTVVDKSDPAAKTINGWNCKNVQIEAKGINKHDSLDIVFITINSWNSEDVPGTKEIADFNVNYLKKLGLSELALTPGLMSSAMLYQKQFDALIEAAKKAPGEPVTSLMEIKRNQLKGPNIGKAIAEGAKSEIMGKLPFGGLKKKEPPKEEKPTYELKTKFSVNSELTEATITGVDAGKFEIPAGYEKKNK